MDIEQCQNCNGALVPGHMDAHRAWNGDIICDCCVTLDKYQEPDL